MRPLHPIYCDKIAFTIKNALSPIFETGIVEWDLDPKEGYMVSTKKTIRMKDWNGRSYTVTITEDTDTQE